MNADEKIAEKFLNKLGNSSYEPDGNIPPDFLVDNKIAVEVRRLNQNVITNGNKSGLEDKGIPLENLVAQELNVPTPLNSGKKYILSLRYSRPIPKAREIRKNVRLAISEFEKQNEITPFSFYINENIELNFVCESNVFRDKYNLEGFTDIDSGGWVQQIYIDEINGCIYDKTNLVAPFQKKIQ